MCKAVYKCVSCGEVKEISFSIGKCPSPILCEECGNEMRRQFKSINVGMSMPDEILYANNMMVHQK